MKSEVPCKSPLDPDKTSLPFESPAISVFPVTFRSPVISVPVFVTLSLSVLLMNVLTSFDVPNVIYSWSKAVPIFPNDELIILSLNPIVRSPDTPLPEIPLPLVILVTPPTENCENVRDVVPIVIDSLVVLMNVLFAFADPVLIYVNEPCVVSPDVS